MAKNKIVIPQLHPKRYDFPDPLKADKNGLLAWGGDLSPKRLLVAYKQGIFPWFNEGDPILWWSPNPRAILFPDAIKISKSLTKSMRSFEICYDRAFEKVIRACQQTRLCQNQPSWISEPLIQSFCALHEEGFAHSVECYKEGVLVGGLYGLYLGGVFCGESMFSTYKDASKASLVRLCEKLKELKGDFIDCQLPTEHLKSMGAVELSREIFLENLSQSLINFDDKGVLWRL